jgi:demethylmenaquinone methyltransferase/2-methoxy-6-polyprenyl-1,4-benzoquinol methylase
MFGSIAGRYDLMNSVMTVGMHHRWRRMGVAAAGLKQGDTALDVCCGTGDFAFDLYDAVGPRGSVTGVDFSRRMLDVAQDKAASRGASIDFTWGDATALEFEDDSFDAATVGFGIRNIPDIHGVLSEMGRVVRPGGRVICLEITQPTTFPFSFFYSLWFDRVVPVVGRVISRDENAYSYLPSSVKRFPPAPRLAGMMQEAGFTDVYYRLLAGSIIALHVGTV